MPELRKKPLVEAILELRWGGDAVASAPSVSEPDPHYRLLVSRLFDRLSAEYPFYEPLPSAQMPDALVAHVAQHRVRTAEAEWPLVQIGPGLLTLNETVRYTWPDFRRRAMELVDHLYNAHPAARTLKVDQLSLRYLDAIEIGDGVPDLFGFLREKMRVDIRLPDSLFKPNKVDAKPGVFLWQSAFMCDEPRGIISMKLGLGQKLGKNAIIMDTSVESRNKDVPDLPGAFGPWLDTAHTVSSEWFKELTKGELYASFDPA